MRRLLTATCLTPVVLLTSATPLLAETIINTARTTPVQTSTANAGARDDVTIAATTGSVRVTSGTAVTVNSNNSVKNDGAIGIIGANDANGILANTGLTGNIANNGTITIDEDYTATDTDKDGDIDGPFALGARRFAIRVNSGGTFTGNISNAGAIIVEGNESAAIAIDSRLVGSLTNTAAITVTGNNSVGIRAGDVSGNVTLRGAITAVGANSVGVSLDSNIGGALVLQGAVNSTGYRNIVPPADVSKLDADDLLQGGPALRISGNVAGGILFDIPPANAKPDDPDEDKDGIPDANETSAAIISNGAAAAVDIGSATDITIGTVGSTGQGIMMKGNISGNGLYKDVAANAMVIGGKGGVVNITGGITNSGSITALSVDANATALRIGDKANVAQITNSGTIGAAGGKATTSIVQAITIDAGAAVNKITNSGNIVAERRGADGIAVAIADKSGTLSLIENTGAIGINGAARGTDKGIAIDLSANTSGATIKQNLVASGAAPAITGNILFGTGNDVFDIADGSVTGTTRFGAGNNRLSISGDATYAGDTLFGAGSDAVSFAGTSSFAGNIDFGGGADTLTLNGTSRFSGNLTNSAGLAVNIAGGTLNLGNSGSVALSSLDVGATGAINVNIGAGTNTVYTVAGNASFAAGSKVMVKLNTISQSEGSYTIVRAASLNGAPTLAMMDTSLPFLFTSNLTTVPSNTQISLNIRRKTATELGLNGSESRAYSAVFAALDNDKDIANSFLAINTGNGVRKTIQQMLPNHAGGAFETVTQGSRATTRLLADPNAAFSDRGGWGFWVQQVAWGKTKKLGDTAAYDVTGWGMSGGLEAKTGSIGNFGVSLAYLSGKDSDGSNANELMSNHYELAAYWRGNFGGFSSFARVSAAHIGFDSTRYFTGTAAGKAVSKTANAAWNGRLYSATAGLSYEISTGKFNIRPSVSIDHYRLSEKGYGEKNGGNGFNLIVDSRKSTETAVNGAIALGYDFVKSDDPDAGFFRAEIELGRREIISSKMGDTVARFGTGQSFRLIADERASGWTGKLRLLGGNSGIKISGEIGAERQQGRYGIAGRLTMQIGL